MPKYLYKTSKATAINLNRAAWIRALGREKNPEDVTEFLCEMNENETGAELVVFPDDEQWFTATIRAQMSDVRVIPPTADPQGPPQ